MLLSMVTVKLLKLFSSKMLWLERPKNFTSLAVVVAFIKRVRRAIPPTSRRTKS